MTAEVVKLVPNEVSEAFRFDADVILENMKGNAFTTLLILGQCEDGSMEIQGNCNTGEALVLMERAKHELIFGDE
jgi:hypothetical protein